MEAPHKTVGEQSRTSRRLREERGFIAVMFAVSVVFFVGFAGVSLDAGNWYLHISRLQRAVDAAALAGDVYLPTDVAQARQVAADTLTQNGVDPVVVSQALATSSCAADVPICIEQDPADVLNLRVRAETTATNSFLSLLGFNPTNNFRRDATSTHLDALRFGSGSNVLGAPEVPGPVGDPQGIGAGLWGTGTTVQDDFWISELGPGNGKGQGDRFNPDVCFNGAMNADPTGEATLSNTAPDMCVGNVNVESNNLGYLYHIHTYPMPGITDGYLQIEGYDVEFNPYTGCSVPSAGCPGDSLAFSPGTDSTTQINLYRNTSLKTLVANCPDLAPIPSPGSAQRWRVLCPAIHLTDLTVPHDYVLQILERNGAGENRFQLRAGITPSAAASSMNGATTYLAASRKYISINADENLPVFNSSGKATTKFRITQVPTSYAGRTVRLQFYDVGDVLNPTGTSSVFLTGNNPGPGAPGMLTGNCRFTPPSKTYTNPALYPPASDFTAATINGCGMTVTHDAFNAQVVYFEWKVPSSYVCNPPSNINSNSCWLFANMDLNAASVVDNTTWSMLESGVPVRLIR